MFKELWNILNSQTASETGETHAFDRVRLKMLIDYFPVGRKLHYSPEYLVDIVFDTVIIAYRVNNQFIYSRDEVVLDDEGFPLGFRVSAIKFLAVEKLHRLQFLLPDTSYLEMTLDYFSRAEIGRYGQFRQGNAMTLVAANDDRGAPTIETTVDRRQTMKAGPYADSSTILVTPDLTSLVVADKRRKQRVETRVRAELYLADDDEAYACLLGDFSEHNLRLQVRDETQVMPPMESGDTVVVEFAVGETATLCRLRGKLFRRVDEFCVVAIEHIYKFGEFEKVKMMDIVEIKTGLLNRGY